VFITQFTDDSFESNVNAEQVLSVGHGTQLMRFHAHHYTVAFVYALAYGIKLQSE
jgi:hypothetical protein